MINGVSSCKSIIANASTDSNSLESKSSWNKNICYCFRVEYSLNSTFMKRCLPFVRLVTTK
ncbi:hypothetical protein AAA294_08165 [Fusobacterium varium]|uniref:hypothetical protein n=1 Tax=Fusobacterium varium TaxID=856 RepID=UPI0032C09F4B